MQTDNISFIGSGTNTEHSGPLSLLSVVIYLSSHEERKTKMTSSTPKQKDAKICKVCPVWPVSVAKLTFNFWILPRKSWAKVRGFAWYDTRFTGSGASPLKTSAQFDETLHILHLLKLAPKHWV